MDGAALEQSILGIVREAPSDAVISIRVAGPLTDAHWRVLSAANLRSLVPETMNVDVTPVSQFVRRLPVAAEGTVPTLQHSLFGD